MAFDLKQIPRIMRSLSPPWTTSAALQDKWFAGPPSAAPNTLQDTGTVKMEWLLKFERARNVFEKEIVAKEYWKTAKAQESLAKTLHQAGILGGGAKSFGYSSSASKADALYFQSMAIEASMVNDPLDDLFGALGDYNLRLVAAGRAVPRGGRTWRIEVTQVGVYVRDSFDFVGFQPLGYWNAEKSSVSKTPGFGYDFVTNGDYRDWRAKNNKGGDFIIFSDIRTIELKEVWAFTAQGDAGVVDAALPPLKPSPGMSAPMASEIIVAPGDTLSHLAKVYYRDWKLWPLIWEQNRMVVGFNPDLIRPGQRLTIRPLLHYSRTEQDRARERAAGR